MEKLLPTNCRPLQLDHSSEDFASEWSKCINNKASDLTKILEMMEPAFDYWEHLFLKREDKSDILYVTLCKLLSPKPNEAIEKIKIWLNWIEANSDLKSEFVYIFIERVRKFKFAPTKAAPVMLEFVVAKDFKYGIYHHIRGILRLINRDAFFSASLETDLEILVFEEPPDFLLLRKIDMNTTNWQSYLFSLLKKGYSSIKRSEFTNIHRRTLYNEEQKLWEHLKQLL